MDGDGLFLLDQGVLGVQNAHTAVVIAEVDRLLVLHILHGNREAVGIQRDGVCTGRLNVHLQSASAFLDLHAFQAGNDLQIAFDRAGQRFADRVLGILIFTAAQQTGTGHSHCGGCRILQECAAGKCIRHGLFLRFLPVYSSDQGGQVVEVPGPSGARTSALSSQLALNSLYCRSG